MKCMSYLILYSISQLSGVQPAEVHGETWHQSRHCGIPTGMVCCARVCYGVLCTCGMGAVWWGGGRITSLESRASRCICTGARTFVDLTFCSFV